MHHPFHIHGQRFLVLARDGVTEPNLVWKDTVLVRAGEVVDILMDASNPGLWMAHCHIPEHMGSGMMFTFRVDQQSGGDLKDTSYPVLFLSTTRTCTLSATFCCAINPHRIYAADMVTSGGPSLRDPTMNQVWRLRAATSNEQKWTTCRTQMFEL